MQDWALFRGHLVKDTNNLVFQSKKTDKNNILSSTGEIIGLKQSIIWI